MDSWARPSHLLMSDARCRSQFATGSDADVFTDAWTVCALATYPAEFLGVSVRCRAERRSTKEPSTLLISVTSCHVSFLLPCYRTVSGDDFLNTLSYFIISVSRCAVNLIIGTFFFTLSRSDTHSLIPAVL